MYHLICCLAALILMPILSPRLVSAETTPATNEMPGFNFLVIDPQTPNILYAGLYGTMFKIENGGSSWRSLRSQFDDRAIR